MTDSRAAARQVLVEAMGRALATLAHPDTPWVELTPYKRGRHKQRADAALAVVLGTDPQPCDVCDEGQVMTATVDDFAEFGTHRPCPACGGTNEVPGVPPTPLGGAGDEPAVLKALGMEQVGWRVPRSRLFWPMELEPVRAMGREPVYVFPAPARERSAPSGEPSEEKA